LTAIKTQTAHQDLLIKKKILYSDLSHNNILISPDCDDVGNRGILIDFDMAIEIDRPFDAICADFRTVILYLSPFFL
jgi:RIO-like serine/threonine protein kinase